MQTAESITNPPALLFPAATLRIEISLENDFMSEDLITSSKAAADSGESFLLATAALPLKERKKALKAWRADKVSELLAPPKNWQPDLERRQHAFALIFLEGDKAAVAGDVRLADLNVKIATAFFAAEHGAIAARKAAKAAAKQAVSAVVQDFNPDRPDDEPRCILFLNDGTPPSFWRHYQECKTHADASGASAWTVLHIDRTKTKFRYQGASLDAAAEGEQ
jgi:hypothetical protein